MSQASTPQASLFDDALNPAPAAPLAQSHEPRPDPAVLTDKASSGYSAKDIEVLEGLEPVRKRPGMYIGGTDERALHHLFAEVLDNAMDEAVAGHAKVIEVRLDAEGRLTVKDDGRGIPVDPHPKHPGKSALEVIMTVLHSGGKFSGKAYETSGGLHGVGVSVVNALSERVDVTAWKDGFEWRQSFSRGKPLGAIEKLGATRKKGTAIAFVPDEQIFGEGCAFKPARLYRMARSKAYLFGGVEIRWSCDPSRIQDQTPAEAVFRFPNGLADFLAERVKDIETVTPEPFAGRYARPGETGKVEWAVTWTPAGFGEADSFMQSYCNTVPTPEGGTHEAGFRAALTRGLKQYAELTGEKRGGLITAEDVVAQAGALVSVFISNPEFQGQTKEKLSSSDAQRLVENALRDPFDHWLTAQPKSASLLLQFVIDRAEERLKRRRDRDVQRASATRKLRLPGKLADCSGQATDGTEIFLVEGDSAGGSAKQARNRKTQAILPLRGKILNVASASVDKLVANKELSDLLLALGVQPGKKFKEEDLRYERVVIMTDADVDGAHIASLLITFFYRTMPDLIRAGRLYLALPPLYRMSHGGKTIYARDDAHREELLATEYKGKKPEIGRFKGLGEMMPGQLKETTMDPATRTMARVTLPRAEETVEDLVEALMGRKPELRFRFIQENAEFAADDLDV
ncbi:DNA topoisomerase IV subunit B [Phenylobacterium sp. Root77]|jgi:topoisomerase-4 subunit B|uniref:DNA topoisomerase IV subunit B n=2 Tax=Phenylobacterium TaxID=20 RepID=UPI0006FE3025|nr:MULTISPECIES: DNA topoisomerase IV subunit B [unclassified Phenylobacterium]KQW71486.1 DNA topoisomerase IV subunit B [Phenylobacterium sp. Root1277]KQW94406.1 DNA topoisomerase IV subunit B [Phenylobacterium sp. Root1290]KRC44100.1 DNA topoisomerase IV subunit B [Phenylobacterium sp. Root77]